MKNNNFFNKNNRGTVLLLAVVSIAMLSFLVWVNNQYSSVKSLAYSQVIELLKAKQVKEIYVKGGSSSGVLSDGQQFIANVSSSNNFLDKAYESGALVAVDGSSQSSWLFFLLSLFFIGLIVLGVYLFVSVFKSFGGGDSGGNRFFNLGRSKAKFHPANSVKTKFKDVAGFTEVKDELKDVVEFLKNPEKFKKIGASIPKGVLLSGDPGNGKTLLAKAVAGEAKRPFLSISGSDFVEVFVGVGASRVRDLFYQAKRNTPCIIFIDELDTIGRQRGSGMGGGNDEREQTLNQLLSEMDGFATEPGEVIIIGATNRVDVLDKALLRPGRFDRVVKVPYPDLATREAILKIHAKNVKVSDEVDFRLLAQGTPGCSGADLANLINEAALFAAKSDRKLVMIDDLEASRDKLFLGLENKSIIRTPDELKKTAFHEAGHALMNLLLKDSDPFHKVTIVARGHALGVSMSIPEKDVHTRSMGWMIAQIKVALGGLVAEKMFLDDQSSGVSSDLEGATRIARAMVCKYAMSDLGPVSLGVEFAQTGMNEYSQATAEKIDDEVRKIMKKCEKEASDLMQENKDKLEKLANNLLEKETLSASQVYDMLNIPPREMHSFREKKEEVKEIMEDAGQEEKKSESESIKK